MPVWQTLPESGQYIPSDLMKISPQPSKKGIDMMLEYLRPAPSKKFLDELLNSVDGRSLKDRFMHLSYRKWTTNATAESHILFIYGPECCGKSTLVARVVSDLHTSTFAYKSEQSNKVGIVYFFFDNRAESTRTTSSFIRTLIAQLFIQRPDLCNRVYLPRRPLLAGVPDDHLLQALASLLSHFPSTFFVIDGLEMADDAEELVTKIKALVHAPRVHLKLLITARQCSTFPSLFSTLAVQHSEVQILPHEVEENMRSYIKSFLSQQPQLIRLRAKSYVDQLIKESHNNFFCLKNLLEQLKTTSSLRIGFGLKPQLQKADSLDSLFAEKLSVLQSHPQLHVQTSVNILQVLRAFAEAPTVTCLKAVLEGSNVDHVIKNCLQGIVEVKGDTVHFSSPQVCGYLSTGTASLGTLKASHTVPLKISEIEGHTTIALSALEYICSPKFNSVIQDLPHRGELNVQASFFALNWRRHVVRSSRSARLLDNLVKLFRSEQCHEWYTEMPRFLPVFAVEDVFDLELWQWLNPSSPEEGHEVDTSIARPLLENLRSLVLQQITRTKPPEISALLRVTTSLAYVHADKGYYSTAELLLRNNLTIAEKWCPEDKRNRLPFYIFAHSIEYGRLLVGRDRLGREKALGAGALAEVFANLNTHYSSRRLLSKHYRAAGGHRKVDGLDDGVPQHFRWDDTGCPSDSAVALVIILKRQGKFDEASVVALHHGQDCKYEEEAARIILVCCYSGSRTNIDQIREFTRAKIDGLPKDRAAITAIENLGRFHLAEEPPYDSLVSQLYYEEVLERRKSAEGLHSPTTFKTMGTLTTIYLLQNHVGKVHDMFVEFGTLSIPQLRELKPSIPLARLNFALILLTSGSGDLAAEILEELTEGEYDEREIGDGKVTSKALINLAALRISQGNDEAAENLLKRVVYNPSGLNPKELAAAKANLSTVLSRMGREEAFKKLHLESRSLTEGIEVTNACPDLLFGPGTGNTAVGFYSLV